MSGVNPPFNVTNTIFDYGVTNGDLFNDDTKSDMMAAEIFDDDFSFYMENTYNEFDEDLNSYSNLTIVNGQIRLVTGQKKNIKAFNPWTRD